MFKVINISDYISTDIEELLNTQYSDWMVAGLSTTMMILTRPVWLYNPTDGSGKYEVTLMSDKIESV